MTTTQTDSTASSRGAGPLTTVFTTPDFCSSLYWTDTVTPPLSSTVCMPPKFHQLWDYSWGFYSPGICPTGYSAGCSFPKTLASTSLGMVYYGGPVLEDESVQVCCPSGYTCLTGATSSYSKCVATTDASDLAFGIQVRWQESDLSILQTDPTVPGSTFSASATSTGASISTALNGASSGSSSATVVGKETGELSSTAALTVNTSVAASSGGLTSAATIGIAAGSMGLAFGLSALVFLIWRIRQRKREEMNGTLVGSSVSLDKIDPFPAVKPELDSTAIPNSPVPSELQSIRDVAEMPVPHFVAELPGSMPSDYREGNEEKWKPARGDSADWGPTFEKGHEISKSKSVEADERCRRRSTRDSF